MARLDTIPKYDVPDFDYITESFGPGERSYLTREELGGWYGMYGENSKTIYHKAAQGFFCRGGALADYGLAWKPGIDPVKAARALRGLMISFAPKHEVKIGTVAVALANWCDVIKPEDGDG